MTDFTRVPTKLPEAVKRMQALEEFRASASFQELTVEERSMPGVLAATLAQLAASPDTPADVVPRLLAVFDELAAWNDLEVDNLLAVDVIEVIDPADLDRIRPLVGENLMRVVADSEERWRGL